MKSNNTIINYTMSQKTRLKSKRLPITSPNINRFSIGAMFERMSRDLHRDWRSILPTKLVAMAKS